MGLKSLMAQWSAMVPINVAMENGGPGLKMYFLLLMAEILHHQGCMKPYK